MTDIERGVVLTATEVEGCSPAADWSRWIANGSAPGSDVGADGRATTFRSSWSEDLEQLAGLGVTNIMLTLEWAELEPRPGHYDVAAIESRLQVLRRARQLGLRVWGSLVDGTLPGWFADDQGGFLDDRSRTLVWPRHIDWIGETFGDDVDGWVPQREPIDWALRRYLRGEAPPGRTDSKLAAEAVRAVVLADGEAWRLLAGTAPVATYQTVRPIRAEVDNVKAKGHASALERLMWDPWIGALTEGQLRVGDNAPRAVDHLRGAFDRIIVQLRPGIVVDGTGRWGPFPTDGTPGPSGWIAWPEAMAESLRRVADELPDHEIIAAGDLADVSDDGRARPDHVQAMTDLTTEAASDTKVSGWWQSSPIDGYHWRRGFTIKPGLITSDRTETPAAAAFTPRRRTSKPRDV